MYKIDDKYDWHSGIFDRKDVKLNEKEVEHYMGVKNISLDFKDAAMKKLVNEGKAKEFVYNLSYSGVDRSKTVNMEQINKNYYKFNGKWYNKWV